VPARHQPHAFQPSPQFSNPHFSNPQRRLAVFYRKAF